MTDQQEIEWQFEAADLDRVGSWLEEHSAVSGVSVVSGATRELIDTYYDTEDWRFHRAGYALRVRRDGESVEATMKSLAPAADGVRRRREISGPVRSGGTRTLKRASGQLGRHVRDLAGSRDLRPLFEIRTRRKTFAVCPEGWSACEEGASGEVALDETEILVDGEATTRLSRIEIEAASGAEPRDGLGGFVGELKDALELHPTKTSKFEAGLTSSGRSPVAAPDLGPTGIDDSMSAGEVAFAILRRHFATMLAHEPGVRLGEDPEELHDMRVATRRLRAALKLYAGDLPKRAERFERDLRYVADALGEVRDHDIHMERLARQDGESVEGIISALDKRRSRYRRSMLEVLDSDRYERFVSEFSRSLRRGRSPAPPEPIVEAAPGLVRKRYKKARKAAKRLTEDSPPEAFHDLRKKGRRLRYALEPLSGIYGKPAEKMIERLKEIQDDLGEQQDLVVSARTLSELAGAGDLPPQTVFSMGSMAERYTRSTAELRESFLESGNLRVLAGGKVWKRLWKAMQERAEG